MTDSPEKFRRGGPVHAPLPRGLQWSGPVLSGLYSLGVRVHRSLSHARFAPIATLCIGNITLGGTGKTPACVYFARELARRERRPAILMRGYKEQGSDEAEETRGALRDLNIPVILGADRHAGALEALRLGCDAALLDDGFQHWRLKRDLDIVLIDATHPFGGERVVPQGFLREPLKGLVRAGALVVTRSNEIPEPERPALEQQLKRYAPDAPIFYARHDPSGVRCLGSGSGDAWTLEKLRGLRAVVACGIGNPPAFWQTAFEAGVDICEREMFPDHHAYAADDIRRLEDLARGKNANAILVTEKDAVKIEKLKLSGLIPFIALRIDFGIEDAALLWQKVDAALRAGDARRAKSQA